MKLRVLLVTESFLPSMNGVTNSVVKVLETYSKLGIEAIVVAPGAPGTPSEFMGYQVVQSKSLPFMQFPVAIPGFFLGPLMQSFQPDVVHVASPFMLGGQALAIADQLGIPTVAIYQTDLAGYTDRYGMKFARTTADRIVARIHSLATVNLAPTPDAEAYLRQLGVQNVSGWGRGVDIDRYHPKRRELATTSLLRSEFASEDDVVIGYVGRLAPEKRVDRFSELLNIHPSAKVLIVGDGPEREDLERQFEGAPVHFTGVLRGESLADAYAAIDVFVHFGTEETFGQTIQEAQASGLAVVAPEQGGPRFLIEHGHSGLLVDATEPNSYVRAVKPLVESAELRSRLGEGARRAVLRKSWDENNLKLVRHYRQAIELRRERLVRDLESV